MLVEPAMRRVVGGGVGARGFAQAARRRRKAKNEKRKTQSVKRDA
jgi:hypothetical protein